MMPDMLSRRRLLLRMFAGAVLLPMPRSSFGLTGDDAARDNAGLDKGEAEPGKAADEKKGGKGAAKKGISALLTVAVTGEGQPIAQAEVKVKFPQGGGGEATRPTNQAGEAIFDSSATGTAKVRVIVSGWSSALQEVVLKEGPQRLTITLNSLQEPK